MARHLAYIVERLIHWEQYIPNMNLSIIYELLVINYNNVETLK